jgi:AraC-like DNA-binding protein
MRELAREIRDGDGDLGRLETPKNVRQRLGLPESGAGRPHLGRYVDELPEQHARILAARCISSDARYAEAMGSKVAETLTAAPAPQLRHLVESYSGNRYHGFSPGTHLGLPSRNLTVVISLGAPVHVAAAPDRSHAPRSFAALAAGLHTGPAVIAHDGSGHSVSLALTPAGSRSLLGLPAGALAGIVVELEELLGTHANELAERLAAAPSWRACFSVLDDALTGLAGRADEVADTTAYAWHRILESAGSVKIGALANELAYSRRHLTQRFNQEYGLTPKQAARVVRFERSWSVLRRLERSRRQGEACENRSLADVAVECGYYDQAHLARDWNDLAGCAPSAWLAAEELPFVQDSAVDEA